MMIIRDMVPGEIEEILNLWKICDLPYKPNGRDHPDRIKSEMELPQNAFLVAEMDGVIVGSVLVTHDGRKGWINRLSVDPDHRRIGIARALISEAEKWFVEQGIEIFACFIEGYNPRSEQFFRKMDYIEFEGVKYLTKRIRPDI